MTMGVNRLAIEDDLVKWCADNSTPTRPTSRTEGRGVRAAVRGQRGFTLIEMVVVLTIIVGIMGIGFYAVGLLSRAKLRDETLKLSGSIGYVYHQAAVRNLMYRLVIDIEANEYWSELSEDNVRLPPPDTEDGSPLYNLLGDEEEEEEDMFSLRRPPSWESADETLLSRRKLESPVRIAGVMTAHHDDMVVEGKVTITFFPSGYTERAVIYLTDGQGYYTLTIDPLTGKVKTYSERKEIDRDFFEEEVEDEW